MQLREVCIASLTRVGMQALAELVYLSSAPRDGIPLVISTPLVWCPLPIVHPEIYNTAVFFIKDQSDTKAR
jgi:hypothetical protein